MTHERTRAGDVPARDGRGASGDAVRVRRIRTTPDARRDDGWPVEALAAADPAGLLRTPDEVHGEVLKAILQRARTGSRRGARADEHRVYVAIEGGGMRGAVSAGMCVVLEAVGLVGAFDRIYAVSAGAVTGWGMAVAQAALSATYYQDALTNHVMNPLRPLLNQPMIDFDLLFEEHRRTQAAAVRCARRRSAVACARDLAGHACAARAVGLRRYGGTRRGGAGQQVVAAAQRSAGHVPR